MTFALDWQLLIVIALVATAVGNLVHRAWQLFAARDKSSCGGCGTCSSKEAKTGNGFVSIESLNSK